MLSEILTLAGPVLGAIGGGSKRKGQEPEKQGFAALPKQVQEAWLKTYLPRVLEYTQRGYHAPPMMRAANPQMQPGASQAVYQLQQYADRQRVNTGQGMLNPAMQQPQPQQPAPQAMDALRNAMMGRMQYGDRGRFGPGMGAALSNDADYALAYQLSQRNPNIADILRGVNPDDLSPAFRQMFNFEAV